MTVLVCPDSDSESTHESFSPSSVKNFIKDFHENHPGFSKGLELTEYQLNNIKNWIEALRSDKYTQDNHYLRSSKGFCCLGVACDLLDPNAWTTQGRWTTMVPYYTFNYQGEKNFSYIKDLAAANYGLPYELQYFLSSMNDKFNKDFKFIADFLEELIKDN